MGEEGTFRVFPGREIFIEMELDLDKNTPFPYVFLINKILDNLVGIV